jgi:chorismate--pyruvate lyase
MGMREIRSRANRFKGRSRGSHWHPLGKALRPPQCLRPWLLEPKSLTVRLQRHYGDVRLRVIRQALGEPYNDEGSGQLPLAVCRAVVLSSGDGSPLVVAHSILPAVPRGPLSVMFQKLGRQSLGSLLFTHRGFVRRQREWAFLDVRHPLYRLTRTQVSNKAPARLWARRAVYSLSRFPAQSVQVTEVFCMAAPS